jgi:hypothetical protein
LDRYCKNCGRKCEEKEFELTPQAIELVEKIDSGSLSESRDEIVESYKTDERLCKECMNILHFKPFSGILWMNFLESVFSHKQKIGKPEEVGLLVSLYGKDSIEKGMFFSEIAKLFPNKKETEVTALINELRVKEFIVFKRMKIFITQEGTELLEWRLK